MAIVAVVALGIANLVLGIVNVTVGGGAWLIAINFFASGWCFAMALTMYWNR